MPSFPHLKTSAVIQYPATKSVRYRNETVRFLDGMEQRYRDSAGPLRRWEIQLSDLDEGEAAAIEQFFEENQGALGRFSFTDPWDGQIYPNCSLLADDLAITCAEEMRCATSVAILENRE